MAYPPHSKKHVRYRRRFAGRNKWLQCLSQLRRKLSTKPRTQCVSALDGGPDKFVSKHRIDGGQGKRKASGMDCERGSDYIALIQCSLPLARILSRISDFACPAVCLVFCVDVIQQILKRVVTELRFNLTNTLYEWGILSVSQPSLYALSTKISQPESPLLRKCQPT